MRSRAKGSELEPGLMPVAKYREKKYKSMLEII
jgi:hypothetical protein